MVGGIKQKMSKFIVTFMNPIMQCKVGFDQIAMETKRDIHGY